MITIDISTKFIEEYTRIYVVRPGAHYRLFTQFIDEGFVGPELPSLELPTFEKLSDVKDLTERVMRSVAIRRWHTSGQREAMLPARELQSYQPKAADRATSQFLRVTKAYFSELKKGDLVIVPPINFRGMAEIGEILEGPSAVKEIVVQRYPGEPLSGRTVKWMGSIPKADLPAQALDALQKPTSIFLLARNSWPQIFRRAYGSYSTAAEFSSIFEITSENFRTTDDFYIQAFFNFVVANTQAVSEGRKDMQGFKEAAFADIKAIAPDLFTNVNSPGGISLKSSMITPIVIAAMLAIAIVLGPEAVAAAESGQIVFGNSMAPAGDPCVAQVSEQVVTQLRLLGFDKWAEACHFAREAAERTGVNSNVLVGR
ncbi:hypothetical protein [Mesorhizobium amorphae]